MIGRHRVSAQRSRIPRSGWAPFVASLALATGLSSAQDAPTPRVNPPHRQGSGPPGETPPPASDSDPVVAEVDLQRGILDYQRGRYSDALKRFETIGPEVPAAAYYRGLSLLALRREDDALREFEASRAGTRGPTEADLGAGVARLSLGDPRGAGSAFGRYLESHPGDPYGHYLLGVSLFRQGSPLEAGPHFEKALADASLAPSIAPFLQGARGENTPEGAVAAPGGAGGDLPPPDAADQPASGPPVDYFTRMNSAPGGPGTIPGPGTFGFGGSRSGPANPNRRYNLALINGYEYDSNVALAPSIALTGLGAIGNRGDSRYTLGSFGEYRLVQRQDWILGLIGSTYDTYQFKLSQFNLQDYMGGTYSNVALGRFILGGRYEFHDTLLAGKQFTTDHRFTPNLTLREGTFGHFTTFYEYEGLDVKGFALIPAQRRTGDINAVGATQAVYLANGNGRLYFNYRYENARTQGSDFDRSTNQVSARLEIPLPGKTVFNTEFRQFFDDYKHPNSLDFLGRPRVDYRIEARAGIQTFFTSHLSLRLDYVYTNNQSNVENLFGTSFYTYHRNVFSTLLVYDF